MLILSLNDCDGVTHVDAVIHPSAVFNNTMRFQGIQSGICVPLSGIQVNPKINPATTTITTISGVSYWSYSRTTYTYILNRFQAINICDLVSQNGFFHTEIIYDSVTKKYCLATITISGYVIEAMCASFIPSNYQGCQIYLWLGRFLNLGTNGLAFGKSNSDNHAILPNGDSYQTLYIDNSGSLWTTLISGGSPLRVVLNLWSGANFDGCYYPQRNYVISGGSLALSTNSICQSSCNTGSISAYSNPTPSTITYNFQYSSQNQVTASSTSTVENGWSVSQSMSATATFSSSSAIDPGPSMSFSLSYSVSSSVSQTTSNSQENTQTSTTQFTHSATMNLTAGQTAYNCQQNCNNVCVHKNSSPVYAIIKDNYGFSGVFVIGSSYQSVQTTSFNMITTKLTTC